MTTDRGAAGPLPALGRRVDHRAFQVTTDRGAAGPLPALGRWVDHRAFQVTTEAARWRPSAAGWNTWRSR